MERFDWLKCPFSSPVDSPHMKRAPKMAPFSYADRFQLEKKSKEKKEERRGVSKTFIGEGGVDAFHCLQKNDHVVTG